MDLPLGGSLQSTVDLGRDLYLESWTPNKVWELRLDTGGGLATALDWEMLEVSRGVHIASGATPDNELPLKQGREVSIELGGRYLLRYVLPDQVGLYTNGSNKRHFTTPTPYAPEEANHYLCLPSPKALRLFVILLNPYEISAVQGPRWVRLGRGIEYLLPNGFPRSAIVRGWELSVA